MRTMSKNSRTAHLDDELSERFDAYREQQDFENQSRALCKTIDEGLRTMGYQPAFQDESERWLDLTRGIGSVLGLAALALFGLGTFLGPLMNRFGFGLGVASIAFFAGAEIADRHGPALLAWAREAARKEAKQWTATDDGGER